jgi:hypothetical protein
MKAKTLYDINMDMLGNFVPHRRIGDDDEVVHFASSGFSYQREQASEERILVVAKAMSAFVGVPRRKPLIPYQFK